MPRKPSISSKPKDFSDMKVLSELGNSTYPVYLTFSASRNEYNALKIFPYKNSKV